MFQVEQPDKHRTIDILRDLIKQLQEEVITCKAVRKTTHKSETERIGGKPLVTDMDIALSFSIAFRRKSHRVTVPYR